MQNTLGGVLEPKCLQLMLRQSTPGPADPYPLARKVASCLGPKKGAALEALWFLPVSEAFSFCIPYSHLCRILSVWSRNEDVCCRCSGKVLPCQADPFSLARKVVGCLGPVQNLELILLPATAPKLFIRFRSSLVEFLGSLIYTSMSSADDIYHKISQIVIF